MTSFRNRWPPRRCGFVTPFQSASGSRASAPSVGGAAHGSQMGMFGAHVSGVVELRSAAARITSTGAGRPVQASRLSAP